LVWPGGIPGNINVFEMPGRTFWQAALVQEPEPDLPGKGGAIIELARLDEVGVGS
jgi:hypothetical protein